MADSFGHSRPRFDSRPLEKETSAYRHRDRKRDLRNLRGTYLFSLNYTPGRVNAMQAFLDSYYAADTVHLKSMAGHIVKIGSAAYVYGWGKQYTVALSTIKSEYYAMTLAAIETASIRQVLEKVGFDSKESIPL